MGRRLFILLLLAPWLAAQSHQPGPQVLTFFSTVDDSDQPFALYLPQKLEASRKYPLVVSLHGAGSNHRLNLRRVFGKGNLPGQSDAEASRVFPPLPEVDFIVASPLARGTVGYQGIPELDVYQVLEEVKRRFPIDEDRIYLTGLSMGGGGTLWLGLTRPDIWAAIAPICAAAPPGSQELAANALNLAVHLFHGDADPVVPVESSRQWHKALLDAGAAVTYQEYPGVRHNAWDFAYANANIFRWFARHKRNRFPDHVRFVTRQYRYPSAYWVKIEHFTAGQTASIDAAFTAANAIRIRTAHLRSFTLRLEGHPRLKAGAPLEIVIDDTPLKVSYAPQLPFRKTARGWEPGLSQPGPEEKRSGAEGPIREAVSRRHIYVYGTADSPPAAERERRRMEAARAADWTWRRFPAQLHPPVMADTEVNLETLPGADLVLFGNRLNNSLIARFADRLPVELRAGAADYGLVQIVSIPGRYLLVNSGLPWWTGAEHSKRESPRYLSDPLRTLLSFQDFILFKGDIDGVIAEGVFDPNWKLPAAAARAMAATGAVDLH